MSTEKFSYLLYPTYESMNMQLLFQKFQRGHSRWRGYEFNKRYLHETSAADDLDQDTCKWLLFVNQENVVINN